MSDNELREHDIDSDGKCWCKPKPIEIEGSTIWVHNDLPVSKRKVEIAKSA